eukprot:9229395-Karenia_brevis.AAC.1
MGPVVIVGLLLRVPPTARRRLRPQWMYFNGPCPRVRRAICMFAGGNRAEAGSWSSVGESSISQKWGRG